MFVCRRSVLEQHRSDGLNRIGPIKWSLALCVMAVFILVYFSLWKGVRSTGKVSVDNYCRRAGEYPLAESPNRYTLTC